MALAAVVGVAGFGVQAVMWCAGNWPTHLTGWPDYRAATVGDLLMVPALTGTLLVSLLSLPRPCQASSLPAALGLTGLLLGVATQAGWVLDDSPQLNWAMERPHHFTFPGWYHAGFLVAAATLTGVLLGSLTVRMRTANRLPLDQLLACAAVGFASLLGADLLFPAGPGAQHVAPGGIVSVTVTLSVTVAALVTLRPRGAGRDLGGYARRCVTGAVLALAVTALSVPWPSTRSATAVAAVVALAVCVFAQAAAGRCGDASKQG
ncbi:hypothetical protein ACWC4E_29190 [Streptomyces sp. NPDC001273]|uniref:hypothetical protein n=1 Tax=unclassified Streptomyces TaxID=2593676 RepID=UPI003409FFB9